MQKKKVARSVYAGIKDTLVDINAVAEKIPEEEIALLTKDLKHHWSIIKTSLKSGSRKKSGSKSKTRSKRGHRAAA